MIFTWPIRAIVNPAKAPPSSTKPTATAKYIHNVGSSAGFPSSSSAKIVMKDRVGAARRKGRLAIAKSKSFVSDSIAGRAAARSFLGAMIAPGVSTRRDIMLKDDAGGERGYSREH